MSQSLQELLIPITTSPEVQKIFGNGSLRPLYSIIFNQAQMMNKGVIELERLLSKNEDANLLAPTLFSLTFCIELLLKAYIVSDHKEINSGTELKAKKISIVGHKYSELFDKISKPKQDKILKALSTELAIPEFDKHTFKQILKAQACDNTFVEWRYVFEISENMNTNLNLLLNLSNVLGKEFAGLNEC